jgi:hypothetical protein
MNALNQTPLINPNSHRSTAKRLHQTVRVTQRVESNLVRLPLGSLKQSGQGIFPETAAYAQ